MGTVANRPRIVVTGRAHTVIAAGASLALAAAGLLLARGELAARSAAGEARRAVAAGRYAEAEDALGRWMKARPKSAEARYLKARVAHARGCPQEAVSELATARSLGHPAAPLDRLDAILRANAGRYSEAEPVLRRVLADSRSPDPEAAEALALIYLQTYRFPDAAAVIDRWAREAPDDARPYLWRTEVNRRLVKDRDALIRDYRAALERDPELERARLGLAEALRQAGRVEEAAPLYASYAARKPDDPAGHLGAGLVALERGDEAGAAPLLDRALELAPGNAAALSARSVVASRRGDDALALDLLDRSVRANPHAVEARHRRALCLARLGRHDEARAEREAAARLREDDKRLAEIQQALLKRPGDVRLQGKVARWLFEHGHQEDGIRWARKILGERPRDPEANRLMAEHHERGGNPGLANYHRLQAEGPMPPE